jgi:acyl-CoA synthetase (AMP-forming)/AMP-acid ligase II
MTNQHYDFSLFPKRNAATRSESLAFAFTDGAAETARLTHGELDLAARSLAAALQDRRLKGRPVLLLLDNPFDFVRAFFGCLYAGAIAVPVNLPTRKQRLEKVVLIAADCGANVALMSVRVRDALSNQLPGVECIDVSQLTASPQVASLYREDPLERDAPAFLQYTSGSTGTPKGVIVSHTNLIANQAMIRSGFANGPDTVWVSWLPLYHDMGLVGSMLQPTYLGCPCAMMPPLAFVQRPAQWLRLISEVRGTVSGAPNFAYEMCVRRVDPEDMVGVDLSSWRVAFNGAEPVQARTLARFSEKFAAFGFSSKAFYPCYGMAEATLYISGGIASEEPRLCRVAADALERGESSEQCSRDDERAHKPTRSLVSCGFGQEDLCIAIVDPETGDERPDGQVGEVWISGSSIALGYWNNPTLTMQTFHASTSAGRGPFLRTGDLGFRRDGELYIAGRAKDVIIVSGKNHYPQDIELTVSQSHVAFGNRPGAALALIDDEGSEQVAVVQELERKYSGELLETDLLQRVRDAVLREHGIALKQVLFVQPGKVPVTTSGKVQRARCRSLLLTGQLSSSFSPSALSGT